MEKNTARQIGYIKPKEIELIKNDFKYNLEKEDDIINWINKHDKFKWSKMCLEIGIDKSNFQRMLKSGKINLSNDKIKLIQLKLKEYGYGK